MRPRIKKCVKKEQGNIRFAVDCSAGKDLELNLNEFADYVRTHFKINNRKHGVAEKVACSVEGDSLVIQTTGYEFAKRYVKYLTKRFLYQDYQGVFRVLSIDKETYTLKPYTIEDDDDEAGTDDE
ncbi:Hypothetical protein GLP15_4015 [Giardia lamblia P15]|uniref:Large ribosomal subunit protein eL22 n=1 Tax=Giardia intestinalis (strain P15) TaxID=658858 RepID=E1F8D6_GIAIA|nr:Hypothetical protein GLP15_4015 [Giardia lamblia P15]